MTYSLRQHSYFREAYGFINIMNPRTFFFHFFIFASIAGVLIIPSLYGRTDLFIISFKSIFPVLAERD